MIDLNTSHVHVANVDNNCLECYAIAMSEPGAYERYEMERYYDPEFESDEEWGDE